MFSPYYASQRRYGWSNPDNHCAINVALYGASGKKWAMTERGAAAVHRNESALTVGPSRMSWNGTSLDVDVDEITSPFPSRIKGVIRLHPHALNPRSFAIDSDGDHTWWPIAPVARVEVLLDKPGLRWSGSGYLDSNYGAVPLERTFKRWDWSRTVEETGTSVLYDVTSKNGDESALAIRFDKSGGATDVELPPRAPLPGTLWGVDRATRAMDGHSAKVIETLEDGPFYSRSLVSTNLGDKPVTAIHESLSLDRFGSLWVQGLLPFRMPRRKGPVVGC